MLVRFRSPDCCIGTTTGDFYLLCRRMKSIVLWNPWIAMGGDCARLRAMDAPLANPLYNHWLTVVAAHGTDQAVRDTASGHAWTFGEIQELAFYAPPCPPVLHSTAKGMGLILDVLRAWRDGAVLIADDGSGMTPPPRPALAREICHLKITSGSTGVPRCVMFRPDQLAADAKHIVATMGLRRDWPNLGVISMAHSYGFSNLVLPLLLHGIPLWLLDSPLPESLRHALLTGHTLTLPAVPAMWQVWDRAGIDFSNVGLAISAGAPLPVALESSVFARTGLKIHNFYGSSECGGIAYDRTDLPRTDPTLAGTAMADVVLTVDPESGCLRVTSAAVADGYLLADGSSDATNSPGGGSWLSQDLARIDDTGAVHLLGRASEFISVAGHKIPPAVIEDAILRVPGVRWCVAFGVPSTNPIRVEDVVVCVNMEPGTDPNNLKATLANMPSTYTPRHWWFRDDLQPDARGKVPRSRWRADWLAQQADAS